jgi:cell division protein FtsB
MKKRRTSADGRFRRVSPAERRGVPHGKWIVTLVLTLVFVLAALFGSDGWMVVRKEAVAVDALDGELAEVEADLADVQERTRALVEPGGLELERVAREDYLMHAEGEEVIHLVPAEGEDSSESPEAP